MGVSSHRYVSWSSTGELQRVPASEGQGIPCVAAACRGQMEDHELQISAQILDLKYSETVPVIQGQGEPVVQ